MNTAWLVVEADHWHVQCPLTGTIVLQKFQKALGLISRQKAKKAKIADRCGHKPVTGVVGEFGAWWRGPPHHFQSPRLQFGELESPPTKRLFNMG